MYVLGIDFGGGAAKATLLSSDGVITATHSVEYPTNYPQKGWCEQNPHDWYAAARQCIGALLEKSGIPASEIAAVSLDAATHTAVLLDDDFQPLRPAIHWTDSRSVAEVAWLKEHFGQTIETEVLHKPDTIWTLPQLLWVRKNEPEIWRQTRKILFAKDFVRHQLTGDFVTDKIEAQGSMFFNYRTMDWSLELCEVAEIQASMLPKLVQPIDVVGEVTSQAAEETGLVAGTPVLCGTTDTVMEVFASGAVCAEDMTVKLATAGRICVVTRQAYPNRNLINYSHVAEGLWYPGTATKSCAASYRWYRDTFGGKYRELDAGAEAVPAGCQGLLFHPYLNGELTPYADPLLCGSFVGMRAHHTRAHFTRAVLEGVALSMLDCRLALEEIQIPHADTAVVIGGGAASPLWRQILADTLDLTLVQKENSDSSFGSAMLAATAVGMFRSLEEAVKQCSQEVSRTFSCPERHALYRELFRKYKNVQAALEPIYHES
ncbi:MAG: xylulokinase [Planctomycetia bacterium]|nr:xylulokinase [Planctomycetia bacterium]